MLRACLDSLRSITNYEGFEAVVVDNQSDDLDSLTYLDSIRDVPGVRVISLDALIAAKSAMTRERDRLAAEQLRAIKKLRGRSPGK